MTKGRRSAAVSTALAAVGGAVAAATTWMAHLGRIPPVEGLTMSTAALILGGFPAILAGFLALFRGATGEARRNAIVGALLGTVLVLIPATLGARASRMPPIHDLTTNLDDPPTFFHAGTLAANRDRNLSYPSGLEDTPERQAKDYSDLAPIVLSLPADRAFDAALETAEHQGWDLTWADPGTGRFEATATSSVYRLVDDIAVRVRATDQASVVDVRSVSRHGVSDFGRNARRIRAFSKQLAAQNPL
ncbi:MAG: DUF1499 domain-containing protein [Acidobacteria bacterium]|nr:DUF1499 domain-containing protein [Acidobacteriota bacterium]